MIFVLSLPISYTGLTLSPHSFGGGILFSSFLFVFIAVISLYSYLLLVDTKFVVSGSFGGMCSVFFSWCFLNASQTLVVPYMARGYGISS